MEDYYKLLGLNYTANTLEIKEAYFNMLEKCPKEEDKINLKKIKKAYKILINKEKRYQYNNILALPNNIKQEYIKALNLIGNKNFDQGISILEDICKEYPYIEIIQYELANIYLNTDNSLKSIAILKQLLMKDSNNALYLSKLGQAYIQKGWIKKAIDTLNQSIAIDNDNFDILEPLIKLHINLNNNFLFTIKLINEALNKQNFEFARPKLFEYLANCYIKLYITKNDVTFKNKIYEIIDTVKQESSKKTYFESEYSESMLNISMYLMKFEMFTLAYEFVCLSEDINKSPIENEAEINLIKWTYTNMDILNKINNNKKIDQYISEYIISQLKHKQNIVTDKTQEQIKVIEYNIANNYDTYKISINELKKSFPEIYNIKKDFWSEISTIKKRERYIKNNVPNDFDFMSQVLDAFESLDVSDNIKPSL